MRPVEETRIIQWLKMRLCEELRKTITSDNDIIKREKIADLVLISFILCLANE